MATSLKENTKQAILTQLISMLKLLVAPIPYDNAKSRANFKNL